LHSGRFLLTDEGVLKVCGLGEPAWLAVPALVEPKDRDVSSDLADLGRVAAGWAALAARRKGARPLAEPLQAILDRLTADAQELRYPDAAALLEELDRVAAAVPPNVKAWERLLHHVREHAAEEPRLRQSA
jgi:hypothetical protein